MTFRSCVRKLSAPLALVAGAAGTSEAQRSSDLSVGARVRIVAPSIRRERFVGRVEAMPADSIMLDTSRAQRRLGFDTNPVLVEDFRRVTIPVSAIRSLEISRGRTRRRTTILGALIGAGSGAVLFGIADLPEINPTFKDFTEGFLVGSIVGAVAGGVIGFALGGERWDHLPVVPR